MKKKWLAIILCGILLLSNIPFTLAQEKVNLNLNMSDVVGDDGSYINSLALVGDTLYLLSNADLYMWKDGDEKIQAVSSWIQKDSKEVEVSVPAALLSDGEQLYAYNQNTAQLLPVSVENGKIKQGEPLALDLEEMKETYGEENEHSYYQGASHMLLHEGKLYMVFNKYIGDASGVYSFDLKTGEKKKYEAENILYLAPYKDGQLLALVGDYDHAWDPETGKSIPPNISIFDPQADTLTDYALMIDTTITMESNVLYEAQTDSLLYTSPNKLMRRRADGSEELCAYIASEYLGGNAKTSAFLMADGRFACIYNSTLSIRSTDAALLPKISLNVFGYPGGAYQMVEKAGAAMADVPILQVQQTMELNPETLAQSMISGNNNLDVLFVDAESFDLQSLIDKGYCLDLSGNEAVKSHMDQLYPFLSEQGIKDGKVFAVPVSMTMDIILYNEKAFQKMNLTPPATVKDFLQLTEDWYAKLQEEYSDYRLSDNDYDSTLFFALSAYSDHVNYHRGELKLNDPVFIELMQAAEKADATMKEQPEMDWGNQDEVNEFFQKQPLYSKPGFENFLTNYTQFSLYADKILNIPKTPLPLKVTEDGPAIIPVRTILVFINAKTQHPEEALRFVENLIKTYREEDKAQLYPGCNEPVIDNRYEKNIEQIKGFLVNMEEALKTAEGAEKTQLENSIAQSKSLLESPDFKYSITEEAIKVYRELMQHAYVKTIRNNVLINQADMSELMSRYMEKQINLEQLIQEGDSKLRLIQLENQ